MGVLVPSSDTGIEAELPWRLAGRASVHVARVPLAGVVLDELGRFVERAAEQLPLLRDVHADLLVVGCTSGTFVHGRRTERLLLDELEREAGIPVLSTAEAMVGALAERGTRVRLRTSYGEEITALEARYLVEAGLRVTTSRGLGIEEDERTARLGLDELRALVGGDDQVDAVMLSCTNFRTLGIERELENAAGAPVVSSNNALARGIVGRLERVITGTDGGES
ncbi:MAG TPA: aspartate/glutamate racemase family protein [Arachnia sp.]|nr:aspartate/glutamate racemase family protein [Arachnia sp.]HMT87694.1 aspartate/glutamate racemase family protein [Arachnia sp.]